VKNAAVENAAGWVMERKQITRCNISHNAICVIYRSNAKDAEIMEEIISWDYKVLSEGTAKHGETPKILLGNF